MVLKPSREPILEQYAAELVAKYGFTIIADAKNRRGYFELSDHGLSFVIPARNLNTKFDFTDATSYYRQLRGNKQQALAKAVGANKQRAQLTVIDLSAGAGQDGYALACLGIKVTMLERNLAVVALLQDALKRARAHLPTAAIAANIKLIHSDAKSYLSRNQKQLKTCVLYFDPMYPKRQKSAQVKQKSQLLQQLVGKDEDAATTLEAALAVKPVRVVVKRPKSATHLGDYKPDFVISSKNTRYDIYSFYKSGE